jgi:hypothetical protein
MELDKIDANAQAQESKAKHFEKHGSLGGWKNQEEAPKEMETRTVNGVQYRKVKGGWEKVK